MWKQPIRLAVYKGSHKGSKVCEQLYAAHYQELFESSGLSEKRFIEKWATITGNHLENQLPGQQAARAATVLAEPGDLVILLGNTVHGGTGDEGLRLFGSHVHKSQAEKSDLKNFFVHVHNSTELIGNSKVSAGLRRFWLPDESGAPWKNVLKEVRGQVMAIFADGQRGAAVENLLNGLLQAWNTREKGSCRPVMPPKVLSIGKDLAAVQFREAGNKERPLLVFFELRTA
jgi:hypothetical protein